MIKDFNYYIWKDCINKNNLSNIKIENLPVKMNPLTFIEIKNFEFEEVSFTVFDNSKNSKNCYLKLEYD